MQESVLRPEAIMSIPRRSQSLWKLYIHQILVCHLIIPYRKQLNGSQDFLKIKQKLGSAEALVYYNPSVPIVLAADGSSDGIGIVISHC